MSTTRNLQHVLVEKVHKEVKLGRVKGPFQKPLLPNILISPLSLVPKAGQEMVEGMAKSYQLVHNLSFLYGRGVNAYISDKDATVHNKSFNEALKLVSKHGKGAHLAKSDLDSAFHRIPMDRESLPCLGFKINHNYYVDCALPFGCCSAPKLFEEFSSTLDWYVEYTTGQKISHYLDDFFFVHKSKDKCLHLLCTFQNACDFIGFPYSQDKTFLPTTKLEYLGILIDTKEMLLKIPENKRRSIFDTINHLLTRRCCKVHKIQSICGSLNFLNRIV